MTQRDTKIHSRLDELVLAVGEINTTVAVQAVTLKGMADKVQTTDKTVAGNGHMGLKTKVNILWWVSNSLILTVVLGTIGTGITLLVKKLITE
jgi:hypothetical protein